MNKQQLASKVWRSANKMHSKIQANEYKDDILRFIFYKFLSEKEVKYLKENDWMDEYLLELTEDDGETVESVQKIQFTLFSMSICFLPGLQMAGISVYRI